MYLVVKECKCICYWKCGYNKKDYLWKFEFVFNINFILYIFIIFLEYGGGVKQNGVRIFIELWDMWRKVDGFVYFRLFVFFL